MPHEKNVLQGNPLGGAGPFFLRFSAAIRRVHANLTLGKYPFITIVILAAWTSIVVFTSSQHEFWRDEIKPFSIAREAHSVFDIYKETKYDGHPFVWYFLLFAAKSAVNQSIILPVISITIALSAVALFMFTSPFPFLFRCLFIFGALPLYEYSVMARDYGISMLLLLLTARLYPMWKKYRLLFAAILFILANTNIPSAIFVSFIALMILRDCMRKRTTDPDTRATASNIFFFAFVFSGVLLCAFYTWPKPATIVTTIHTSFSLNNLAVSILKAIYAPGHSFSSLAIIVHSEVLVTIILYITLIGLIGRFNIFFAGLGVQIVLGVFFRIVYKGAFRHQGLYFIFLIFLYWILFDAIRAIPLSKNKRIFFLAGLYGGLLPLLVMNCLTAKFPIMADITMERSSSKALGNYLTSSNLYKDAIIVPEPDYLLESLPYYAKNQMYFPREHRFGSYVNFSAVSDSQLTLGNLVATAQDIKNRYHKPVLIVFGHWNIDPDRDGMKKYSYNKAFSWNQKEVNDFRERTKQVKLFNAAYSDENYQVYELK